MKLNTYPGKLIALEGLDGAGTTSQAERLADWLRSYRDVDDVWVTREPSASPAGAQIRSVLLKRLSMDPLTLAALFVADRLDHLYHPSGIIQRLQAGEWVIMDRYYLSSFAYQALSMTQDQLRWLWFLHDPCIIPDVTFFLDVPVEECLRRIGLNRGFHFELFEKEDSLDRVRSKYVDTIHRFRNLTVNPQNIQMIDGTQSITRVARCIRERVEMIFLDETYLSFEQQQQLWREWPGLLDIRRRVEKELGLAFVTVKKLAESRGSGGGGNRGGYQLKLASDDYVYHIAAYFNSRFQAMRILPLGRADETLEDLRALCPPRILRGNQVHHGRGG